MSNATPARPTKSVAVTVLGWSTLFLGGVCAALGVGLMITGVGMLSSRNANGGAGGGGMGGVGQFFGLVAIVFGLAVLLNGLFVLVSGRGVVLRKKSGRRLTFIVAVMAILVGLACLSPLLLGNAAGLSEVISIAIGAALILYGILAFVILIKHGAEFGKGTTLPERTPAPIPSKGL